MRSLLSPASADGISWAVHGSGAAGHATPHDVERMHGRQGPKEMAFFYVSLHISNSFGAVPAVHY